MSVASEITRIQNAKASLKTSINAKTDSEHQITDETIDEYADFVDSISSGGGADLSDYFTTTIGEGTSVKGAFVDMIKNIPETTIVSGTSLYYAFNEYTGTTISLIDTSNVENMTYMFYKSVNLTTVPSFNMSSCTDIMYMFADCTNLQNVPIFYAPNVSKFTSMFSNCPNLTDTSLDNILQMCINSNVSLSSRRKLSDLGFTSTNYPASRIQTLPHYQDFLNARWTIGY